MQKAQLILLFICWEKAELNKVWENNGVETGASYTQLWSKAENSSAMGPKAQMSVQNQGPQSKVASSKNKAKSKGLAGPKAQGESRRLS